MMTTAKPRINSIDVLRGLVMIVMALDHTRDFFHADAMFHNPLDLKSTTPILFFTRWITHYCAPIFVFLSGISAGLAAANKSKRDASAFLIKRGIWLLFVEVVIITFGLTFNPIYSFIILQVIWAMGWSMILLGLCMRLSRSFVLTVGLIIVGCHNIFNFISLPAGTWYTSLIQVLITSRAFVLPLSSSHFVGFFYAILPWTGVMFIGYGIHHWFTEWDAVKRRKALKIAGLATIFLFIALRFINIYGDQSPYQTQPTLLYSFLSFIDASKYPPSLQYVCMTIGPALLMLALFEPMRNLFTRVMIVYGKVPFFYYILHFYILHFLLLIIFFISGYGVGNIITPGSPFLFRPNEFGFALPVVYLIWLSVVAVLYRPSKWFSGYKSKHKEKWWIHYV